MKCSIVIRAFNEERNIGRLLEGIRSQTVQDVEIILVDSGSTDATAAIAVQYGTKIVNIPPAEFTFGRSLNLGLAAATRDLVAIASAHVYPVYPDWLERLLEPFDDPRVALSYGKQRGGETSCFSEKQVFAHWYPDHSTLVQGHPFCNNANAAIHRSVWQKNPYDETLTGLEDLAWARGALDGGYTIAYMADAEIVHLHNETPHEVANRYRREAIAFKRLYPRRISACTISSAWHPQTSPATSGIHSKGVSSGAVRQASSGFASCNFGVPTRAIASPSSGTGNYARPSITLFAQSRPEKLPPAKFSRFGIILQNRSGLLFPTDFLP